MFNNNNNKNNNNNNNNNKLHLRVLSSSIFIEVAKWGHMNLTRLHYKSISIQLM